MYFVYILWSPSSGRFYIGQTNELNHRLSVHNQGLNPSTKAWKPWVLVWHAEKPSRKEAIELEKKLKNLHSPERLRRFVEKYGGNKFPAASSSPDESNF
ncbi:MAG: GIY-YIG nuclease family protein [Bacteroidetes bacterium]|nr:GIY-YIG nuclease family protein [Bacteroidota bacterium]